MQSSVAKTLLITGANQGIGYSVVKLLSKTETFSKIVFTSRSLEKGEAAKSTIQSAIPDTISNSLELFQLDLLSEQSIDSFVSLLVQSQTKLDCVVHNAGVFIKKITTDEEFRTQIDTNFFNTRYLNEQLIQFDLISQSAKINFVSSGGAFFNRIKDTKPDVFEKIQLENLKNLSDSEFEEILDNYNQTFKAGVDQHGDHNGWKSAYGTSKLFLSVYAYLLSQKSSILGKNIQVYSMTPGFVATNMTKGYGVDGATPDLTPEQGAMEICQIAENFPFEVNQEMQGRFIRTGKVACFNDCEVIKQ